MKQVLDDLANRHDKTLASVVRSILNIGIPILTGIWEAEQRMLNDPVGLLARIESQQETTIRLSSRERHHVGRDI
jgi:hypothetical protein